MAQVHTVTGPIDADQLGTTLIHEHLRTQDEAAHVQWPTAGTAKEDPPHEVGPGGDYEIAVREAKAASDWRSGRAQRPDGYSAGRGGA